MKRYIHILTLALLCAFTSCVMDDPTIDINTTPTPNRNGLHVIGAVEDFDVRNVGTRADEVSDSHITEMTMLIFKENGDMLPAYATADKSGTAISNHIHIEKANPTFLIDTEEGILASMEAGITAKYYDNTATDIGKCSIYIIANASHLIGERLDNNEIMTLDALNAAIVDADESLAMPVDESGKAIGFPMIGTHNQSLIDEETGEPYIVTFDLSKDGENKHSVATIPLKKLYSKVTFRMQINSKQVVSGGTTPKFTLEKVEVFNIPSKIRMGYKEGDYIDNMGNNYWYTTPTPKELTLPGKRTIYHSASEDTDDILEFEFCMPEHKVTPYFNAPPTEQGEVEDDIPNYSYPADMPENLRQYYKPKLIASHNSADGITQYDKIATFVRIHGSYTDHNAQINKVSYDIYLGQDETDDFEIKRNQQLNNTLVITGITNHKDAYPEAEGNISIDHRVSMTNKGYNLSMEREAILDSHFEVRPLDIELSPGSSMKVVIPDSIKTWVAMESDAAAQNYTDLSTSPYASHDKSHGVRKYFTTNLVSELTTALAGDGNSITFAHSGSTNDTEIYRVWFYIDENPNVYDKALPKNTATTTVGTGDAAYDYGLNQYRLGKVCFYYKSKEASDFPASPTATVNFQQWNLWRVWSQDGTRYYDIEHEEEYLNNYASNQGYGKTQNGMQWGLDGIQLSNLYQSIVATKEGESLTTAFGSLYTSITDMADDALKGIAKYDFYISRDFEDIKLTDEQKNSLTIRDYKGLDFNKEIATYLKATYPTHQGDAITGNAKIDGIKLPESCRSAFAYCYNKNKRNSNGTIDTSNIKWYLPAIDEIEEIAHGAYTEFDGVFQEQKYWSCQPAYNKENLRAEIVGMTSIGSAYLLADYYVDNINRARATSIYVVKNGNTETPYNIPSHTPGYSAFKTGTADAQYKWLSVLDYFTFNLTTQNVDISEETYNNETPGNLPRTASCRIRAVYRSGTGTKPGTTE